MYLMIRYIDRACGDAVFALVSPTGSLRLLRLPTVMAAMFILYAIYPPLCSRSSLLRPK